MNQQETAERNPYYNFPNVCLVCKRKREKESLFCSKCKSKPWEVRMNALQKHERIRQGKADTRKRITKLKENKKHGYKRSS